MKSCCICFSLRTGGIIIAVMDLIVGILGALRSAFFLCFSAVISKTTQNVEDDKANSTSTFEGINIDDGSDEGDQKYLINRSRFSVFMTVSFYTLMIVCIIQIAIASFLLHGIRKQTISFLKVWMVVKIVFLIGSIVFLIMKMCVRGITIKEIVDGIFLLALNLYFIKVIHALSNAIKEELEMIPDVTYSAKV